MAEQPPWHAAYPAPRNKHPPSITTKDLLSSLKSGQKPGVDLLLIDLRRNDHEVSDETYETPCLKLADIIQGGTIKGSLNLPAQSLYASLPTLLDLCQNAKTIRRVIFYCGKTSIRKNRHVLHTKIADLLTDLGSSRGRGTRAAGWFDDLVQDRGVKDIKSMILEESIAGWAQGGREFTEWMEEYNSKAWKS